MEIIDKILNLYVSFKYLLDIHFYKFFFSYIIISIIWISLIGIVTPVLLISALAFGYYGAFISLFTLVISSLINSFIATRAKGFISKFKYERPLISNNFFLVYLIFRFLSGVRN